jgi:hypothetical protein
VSHRYADEDELSVECFEYPHTFQSELTILRIRITNRKTRRTRCKLESRSVTIDSTRFTDE